jgi:hypothetical protein
LANFNQTQTVSGLQATTINIPTTDIYSIVGTIQAKSFVTAATPGAGGGAGTGTGGSQVNSQIIVTIKQNGSTVYTSSAGQRGFALPALSCTAGDVITINPSSSLNSDKELNTVQITTAVSEGQV